MPKIGRFKNEASKQAYESIYRELIAAEAMLLQRWSVTLNAELHKDWLHITTEIHFARSLL